MNEQRQSYTIDPTALATDKQHAHPHICKREYDWTTPMIVGCAFEMFGIDTISDLSRLQMSQLIDRIVTGEKWVDPRQQRLGI